MNDLPEPLQQLINRYNTLVAQFTAGHITQDDAMSILASTSVTDATGAVWGIAPSGQLTRSAHPGIAGEVSDPAMFVPIGTPMPPSPAFPAPILGDLDTPPAAQPGWGQATGPAAAPAQLPQEGRSGKTPKAPKAPKEPRAPREPGGGILGAITGFFAPSKVFSIVLVVGVLVVLAAVIVPRLTADNGATPVPVATTPGADMPVDAPAATATTPSTTDATTVIAALQSGDPAKVQAMIAAQLDPVTTLRTQALWKGVSEAGVTVTPYPAAAAADGTATQTWSLTRPDEATPVATVTVTWVSDGATWKLTAAPAF